MKKILAIVICSAVVSLLHAQQQAQYTQFMYNKLGYNPGYAGSNDAACITAMYRHQWTGIDGAPKTQLLSFNMPLLNKRIGIGANLVRNTIGISESWTLSGAYSYRIRFGGGVLGVGAQASIQYLGVNFRDSRLQATQPIPQDQSIPASYEQKYSPNFGAGLYFNTDRYFIGVSVPNILKSNIDFSEDSTQISRSIPHAYLMTGLVFKISPKVKLQPQILLKYVPNSPFDADINLTALFADKYSVGLAYRLGGNQNKGIGESIDLLFSAQIRGNILFGLAYDITLSQIKDYDNGSIEAVLRYCFGQSKGDEYVNPRFF